MKNFQSRCSVCGKFTSRDDYCPEHSREFPDCKCFKELMGIGINVCVPNVPYSCRRSKKEKLCNPNRDCNECGYHKMVDIIGKRVCEKSPLLESIEITDYAGFIEKAAEIHKRYSGCTETYLKKMTELAKEWSEKQ